MSKTAKFETNVGTITAELFDKDAPATVANFEKLANSGFYGDGSSDLFDHVLRFKKGHKVYAIVAQPYSKDFQIICKAQRRAIEIGKACHVPPHPWCSFHYPKWTQFLVFTTLDHQIEWLPEQISGLAWSSVP